MFSKKKESGNPISEPTVKSLSILSSSITVTGKICIEDDLRVDGCVNGDIESKGKVVIGPEGCVKGNIKSKSVYVKGKIYGDVIVSEIITLKASSYYKGQITAKNIEIEAGASFYGNCKMEKEEKEKKKEIVYDEVKKGEPLVAVSNLA